MEIKEETNEKMENQIDIEDMLEEKAIEETAVKTEDTQKVIEEKLVEAEETTQKRKSIAPSITLFIFILLILSTVFSLANINNKNIIQGITINNINVSGMNKKEAMEIINSALEKRLLKTIKLEGEQWEYYLEPNQIEAKYNIEETVNKAYIIGKEGNIFKDNFEIAKALIVGKNLEIELEYNKELMEGLFIDINDKLPQKKEEPNYFIEDNKLIITNGHSGNIINEENIKKSILHKIENNDGIPIKVNMIYSEASKIDIDKIYLEVHKEPKDAYYKTEPFEVFEHVNGVDFDVDKAKEILKEDKDEYQIELTITEPKILTNEIGTEAFPDLLSSFSTKYDESNRNRSTNLKLAGEKLNGLVIMPEETFSYNKTLGERTVAKGYKAAGGYSGGRVVQTIGGGICQISSTLYDAVVYANLEIVDRSNHMFTTGYIEAGRDATVSYGTVDFKFKNTRKYPIILKANINNGISKIDIYGIKEETEYEIEIESKILSYISYKTVYEDNSNLEPGTQKNIQGGMRGCRTITYKITKLNGVEISRETLSQDTYKPMNRIIQKGPEIVEVIPEVAPEPIAEIQEEIATPEIPQNQE